MGGWVWGPFKGSQTRLWPGSDAFPKQIPGHRAKADVYRLTCSRGPPAQDDSIGKCLDSALPARTGSHLAAYPAALFGLRQAIDFVFAQSLAAAYRRIPGTSIL